MIVSPDAARAIRGLRAHVRREVMDAIEIHLRFEPAKISKSRIKRLRGMARPMYRLRVDELRVFYDVSATTVEVVAVVPKSDAAAWLAAEGVPQ